MRDYIICSGFVATIYCMDINTFLPCEIVNAIVLMIDPIILSVIMRNYEENHDDYRGLHVYLSIIPGVEAT